MENSKWWEWNGIVKAWTAVWGETLLKVPKGQFPVKYTWTVLELVAGWEFRLLGSATDREINIKVDGV